MGAIRTSATALLIAGATGAVLALGPPGTTARSAANAAEPRQVTSFGFSLTPSTVARGGQTVLSVTGCNAAYATVASGVFDTVSVARGQAVRVTVDRDARPGAVYSVSFTCNGETGSADLTIAGGTSNPTTSSTQTATPGAPTPGAPTPQAPTPGTAVTGSARGVQGGVGGSAAGVDLVQISAGAGLLLAAAAGTVYTVRRRVSRRGH